MVLERVEVARLGARLHRDPGHLARRVRVVRRELAARLGLREAAATGGEHDGRGVDVGDALLRLERRDPAAGACSERDERVVRELGARARLERLAERLRDRVPRPVADLQQPLPGRAAAAREPVATVRRA